MMFGRKYSSTFATKSLEKKINLLKHISVDGLQPQFNYMSVSDDEVTVKRKHSFPLKSFFNRSKKITGKQLGVNGIDSRTGCFFYISKWFAQKAIFVDENIISSLGYLQKRSGSFRIGCLLLSNKVLTSSSFPLLVSSFEPEPDPELEDKEKFIPNWTMDFASNIPWKDMLEYCSPSLQSGVSIIAEFFGGDYKDHSFVFSLRDKRFVFFDPMVGEIYFSCDPIFHLVLIEKIVLHYILRVYAINYIRNIDFAFVDYSGESSFV